jgi:hypothetical protein
MKLQLFSLSFIFQKLCPSPIFLFHFHDSHSTGINPLRIFLFLFKTTVSVFGWPSQRL